MKSSFLFFSLYFLVFWSMSAMARPSDGQHIKETPSSSLELHNFTLENGLKVTLIPHGNIPKATISLVIDSGRNSDGERPGISELTLSTIIDNKNTQSGRSIAALGGKISSTLSDETSTIEFDVLSEFTSKAIFLLADKILKPEFSEASLLSYKIDKVREFNAGRVFPANIADDAFFKSIIGSQKYHTKFPTTNDLDEISLDEVKSHASKIFSPNRSHIYVAGIFDKKLVAEALNKAFGEWLRKETIIQAVKIKQLPPTLTLIEREGAPQSTIRLGLSTIEKNHPDYLALTIANTLLGGYFSSRITRNIREQKGYAYYPLSELNDFYTSSIWYQSADVSIEHTGASIQEILHEIRTLSDSPPLQSELDGVKNYMAGVYILKRANRKELINLVSELDRFEIERNYLNEYADSLLAVSPQDVSRVVRSHLVPGRMHLTIVGDSELVAPQVKKIDLFDNFLENR
tara:strand:- start:26 stop:1408 length:1383 start_codon:yes stop_codon:yes gene_type:complete